MGDVDDATACSVLLADADVLIDYLKSEFAILSLVAEYVGRVVVLEQVLGEVRGLTAGQCERSGIDVIAAETERMLQAAAVESNVSFQRSPLSRHVSRRAVDLCDQRRRAASSLPTPWRRDSLRPQSHGGPGRRRSSHPSSRRVDRTKDPGI